MHPAPEADDIALILIGLPTNQGAIDPATRANYPLLIALARGPPAYLSLAICKTPYQFFRIRPRRTALELVPWTAPPSDQEVHHRHERENKNVDTGQFKVADGVRYGVVHNTRRHRQAARVRCALSLSLSLSPVRPSPLAPSFLFEYGVATSAATNFEPSGQRLPVGATFDEALHPSSLPPPS